MPSLSQLPTELDTDEFTSTAFFTTDVAFLTGEVRNYFKAGTLDGRTQAALEIQSKLKREFDAIKFNFARSVGDIDQEGITARRYRTATLFSGVSLDDLERGTFENGVTVTESLRDPKFTPFFPNKKALEDALDEYDNAAPDAQSGTLIGRLITELGAENTGTADQFATMQGVLLQRRGMN